ncbi:MAG: ABC transporter substrate-binding protein, partial [Methanophagales archaeon]|nr:ABC transporter substrate-binding protein [Methanophagales archaeon]
LGRESELTIIDEADRTVTINIPIERVITTWRGQLETLRSIGAADKVVGVESYAVECTKDFFPEFSDVTTVGTVWEPDIELILSLHPDIVILFPGEGYGATNLDIAQDKLETSGLTVLRFTWTTEKTSIPEIRKLGYIFGKRNEAEELIEFYGKVLNSIEEKVECISEEDMPKVYFEWDRYKTAGIYYNIGLSGGKDIFADCEAPEIDPEAVIERDPEIIINMVWMPGITWGYDVDDTADLEETREEVMNRPELQNVTAVKDGNVYIITGHLTFGPYCGSRDFIRIAYFAKWFHPDLFEDLDPKAIHQEYLTRFHGLDIDLNEKGVFVYPPLE